VCLATAMRLELRRALARRVYYGWVIVAACFLASVVVFGTTYAFGVFYDVFLEAFEGSASEIAAVFGLQTGVLYAAAIGAGRLVSVYGQRRVAAVSGAVMVAGLVWTAAARSYVELLAAFGVVVAVGMAGLYVVGYATLPAWFERRRGTATALASAGLGVGLVVVPPGANAVIGALGWRAAMLAIAGFVGLLWLVTVGLFADDPESVGAEAQVVADVGFERARDAVASRQQRLPERAVLVAVDAEGPARRRGRLRYLGTRAAGTHEVGVGVGVVLGRDGLDPDRAVALLRQGRGLRLGRRLRRELEDGRGVGDTGGHGAVAVDCRLLDQHAEGVRS